LFKSTSQEPQCIPETESVQVLFSFIYEKCQGIMRYPWTNK